MYAKYSAIRAPCPVMACTIWSLAVAAVAPARESWRAASRRVRAHEPVAARQDSAFCAAFTRLTPGVHDRWRVTNCGSSARSPVTQVDPVLPPLVGGLH